MDILQNVLDLATGEMTQNVVQESEADKKARLDAEKAYATAQAEAEIKATQKAALLEKLGITADEAALLLS